MPRLHSTKDKPRRWSDLMLQQGFLVLLVMALVGGYLMSDHLIWAIESGWLKWSVVWITMFAMAWPLQFGTFRRAVRQPAAALLGTAINFGIVPLLAWPFAVLLGPDLGPGLVVAAAVPSTLASGAVWTRRAGGDDQVAILVTILTNASCFAVTPWLVFSLVGAEMSESLLGDTIRKLLWFVVLPIGVAQLCRLESRTAAWAVQHKTSLSRVAQGGVLVMAAMGAVQMGQRISSAEELPFTIGQFVGMVVAAGLVHLLAFGAGWGAARQLGLPPSQQVAVAISGSQKTMMVGLSTAINLGVSILPMIVYHTLQLLIDTVLADRHRAASEVRKLAERAPR